MHAKGWTHRELRGYLGSSDTALLCSISNTVQRVQKAGIYLISKTTDDDCRTNVTLVFINKVEGLNSK